MSRIEQLADGLFTGLHHVSFTVSDLGRSVEFYRAFGFVELMRWTEGPEVCGAGLGLPDAEIELAHLRGHGIVLELIAYRAPRGEQQSAAPNHVGTAHLALLVEDIDAAAASIAAAGGTLVSPPRREEQSAARLQVVDPDGIRIELIEPAKDGRLPATAVVANG